MRSVKSGVRNVGKEDEAKPRDPGGPGKGHRQCRMSKVIWPRSFKAVPFVGDYLTTENFGCFSQHHSQLRYGEFKI
jgi:hypothetical protein